MSHRKDTDYLSVSARVRAMENRLLTRERMDRMIDAADDGEARKVLAECGYPEGGSLDQALAAGPGRRVPGHGVGSARPQAGGDIPAEI